MRMRSLTGLPAVVALVAAMLLSGGSSALACGVAARYYSGAEYNYGARSHLTFESASPGSGQTLAKQIEIIHAGSLDTIAWGAYNGSSWAGCPTDTSGWNAHIYYEVGMASVCLRQSGYGSFSMTESDVSLKMSIGACGGGGSNWRFYNEGDLVECMGGFGDVIPYGILKVNSFPLPIASSKHIDVRFAQIDRLPGSGTWSALSNGTKCAASTYRVRDLAADDVWLEEIPMNHTNLVRVGSLVVAALVATSCGAVAPLARTVGEQAGPAIAAVSQARTDAITRAADADGAGCGSAVDLRIDERHNAYEQTIGRPAFPIREFGEDGLDSVREDGYVFPLPSREELVLRHVAVTPGLASYYLGGNKIGDETTLYDHLIDGGVVIFEYSSSGKVDAMRAILPEERVTEVNIDGHDGIILRADELQKGLHAYVLAFEDHGHSIEIRAGFDEPGAARRSRALPGLRIVRPPALPRKGWATQRRGALSG